MKLKLNSLWLVALLMFACQSLSAHDFEVDGIYYTYLSQTDKTVRVSFKGTYYDYYSNEYSGNVVIPATVTYSGITYSVTSIGDHAFYGCARLTTVVIPNGVTNIGNDAFSGCTGLTSITIPSSVTSIGSQAFQQCTSLTSVEIGNRVTSIGRHAFSGCTGLTSLEIPCSVKSIGNCAFQGCTGLTSIVIPNRVKSIGIESFRECSGLTTVVIGDSVKSIGSSAFSGCTGLTSIEIPNGVTSIGSSAFAGCTGLTNIEIPKSVTSIGDCLVGSCSALESITLPFVGDKPHAANDTYQYPFGYIFGSGSFTGGIEIRQSYVINNWNGDAKVFTCYIPSTLKSVKITGSDYIPRNAFINCSMISHIEIPSSVKFIGNNAFEGCCISTLVCNTDFIGTHFQGATSLKTLIFGNDVTSISASTFSGCTRLTSVIIPSSVTYIGEKAFENCQGKLFLNGNIDNFLSSEEGGFSGAKFSEIVVGDSVERICKFAFADMTNLRKITIGKSVNRVLTKAFTGCIHLTEMYCKPTTPPACVSTVFDEDTYLDCTVFVPDESLDKYQTANVWRNFFDMDVNPDYRPDHKLIYRIDGRIYQTVQVEEGATITPIEAPEREGYTFLGWSGLPDDMVMPDHDLSVIGSYAETITATTLAITDGDVLSFPLAHTYESVTYTRTFGNTSWQALYVPFSIPIETLAENGLQVAELNDTHQWDFDSDGIADSTRVEFFTITSGSTLANHPYMVRARAVGTYSLTQEDVDVEATTECSIDCSSTRQLFTFTGTYTGVTGATMFGNNYYAVASGALRRAESASVPLKAQRWYMSVENRDGSDVRYFASGIRFSVDGIEEEDFTLGIGRNVLDESSEGDIYSLEGIRQASAKNRRGLYVRKGQKLIIR